MGKLVALVLAVFLVAPAQGLAQQVQGAKGERSPNPLQTPSDIVRFLVSQGTVVKVPDEGKVKESIDKGAPTFALPTGPSTAMVLQLPDDQAPSSLTIASTRRGLGLTTELFIPRALAFDADFQQVAELGEDQFTADHPCVGDGVAAEFIVDGTTISTRYVLLYTSAELVGERVRKEGVPNLGPIRTERSLEATIEAERNSCRETAPPDLVETVETIPSSFGAVAAGLHPGRTVRVTLETGDEIEGRLSEISSTAMALLVDGKRRDVVEADVWRVEARRSRLTGALNGAAIGLVVLFAFFGADRMSYPSGEGET